MHTLQFNDQSLSIVYQALSKMPFEAVHLLIRDIEKQLNDAKDVNKGVE